MDQVCPQRDNGRPLFSRGGYFKETETFFKMDTFQLRRFIKNKKIQPFSITVSVSVEKWEPYAKVWSAV